MSCEGGAAGYAVVAVMAVGTAWALWGEYRNERRNRMRRKMEAAKEGSEGGVHEKVVEAVAVRSASPDEWVVVRCRRCNGHGENVRWVIYGRVNCWQDNQTVDCPTCYGFGQVRRKIAEVPRG